MLKRLALLGSVLLLAGCATGTQITKFDDRSLGYGWLDIKDVDANRLNAVDIYQFHPKTSAPYYPAKVVKFKEGFLYWSFVLPNGSLKTVTALGRSCMGIICSNTIYKYSFGKQGDDVGAVVIKSPGVYSLGAYKLKEDESDDDMFNIVLAKDAPSKREMLEEILKYVQDKPVVAERIRRELARL